MISGIINIIGLAERLTDTALNKQPLTLMAVLGYRTKVDMLTAIKALRSDLALDTTEISAALEEEESKPIKERIFLDEWQQTNL